MVLASCWPRCTERFKSGKSGIPRFYEVCVKFCFARASLCSSFVVVGELFCFFVLNLVGLVVVCRCLLFFVCFVLFVCCCLLLCLFLFCFFVVVFLVVVVVCFVCCCCFWLLFYGVLFAFLFAVVVVFFLLFCLLFRLTPFFPPSLSSLFLFVCLLFSSLLSPFYYSSSPFFLVGRDI